VQVTTEDQLRTSQYRGEKQRELSRSTCHSIDDYLASLNMNGDVRRIDEADLDRAVQLMGKTNQFNLTSRRHSRDEVIALMKLPESIGLTLRMTDRFGDYGLISVILGVQDSDDAKKTLRIDSWLMSCRMIGRSAEHFFFNALLEQARSLHYSKIVSEYMPSGKNKLVQNLCDELGFTRRMCTGGDSIVYELDLKSAVAARSFVQGGDVRQ
jgi:FkbH-like protein